MDKAPQRQATKSLRQGSMQQKRRDLALARQRDARRDLTDVARRIALSTVSNAPDASALTEEQIADEAEAHAAAAAAAAERLAPEGDAAMEADVASPSYQESAAQQPQRRLNDIPTDLATSWYVVPRPLGQRCLVVAASSGTVSRLRNGRILHRFPSALPGGSRGTSSGSDHCILDCVFHEADQTYYVLDVMCWRGYSLYDCTTEFRLFWAQSKLAECGATQPPGNLHRFRFAQLPAYPAAPEGIAAAYGAHAPLPFVRDGLHFLTKDADYEPGHTPLALAWKDELCSPYFIDTDAEGTVPELQRVVLQVLADGLSVGTADDPPVPFGALSQDILAQLGGRAREGYLLKFAVGPGGIQMADGRPVSADLSVEGPAARRGDADTLNKILFQYNARRSPVTIDELVAASAASLAGSAAAASERAAQENGGDGHLAMPTGGGGDVSMQ